VIVLINGGPALNRFGETGLVGRLISPRSGNLVRPGERWAADNDAFLAWDETRFVKMLCRIDSKPGCLFVAAPDVVGDARATLDRFWDWRWEIVGRGLPVALVGQDGAEALELPWDALDALFIGGSTAWKLSASAEQLAIEARARGKWVHMGRVNSRKRLRHAIEIGCDSIDGTGWSMFPDKYLANGLRWIREIERDRRHPRLFAETVNCAP
jgi:hypothetical protein